MNRVLHQHTFFDSQAASANSKWYPVDWRYNNDTKRTIHISADTSGQQDTVTVQVTTETPASAQDSSVLFVNVTAATGAAKHSVLIDGPIAAVRCIKASAEGTVTVKGLI